MLIFHFQKTNKKIEFENIKGAVTNFDSIIRLVAPKLKNIPKNILRKKLSNQHSN